MSPGPTAAFATEVGPPEAGPVVAAGGRTHWDIGGPVDPAARVVRAPAGVLAFDPADLTVHVRAGTTVEELDDVLAGAGQCVALPDGAGATVGGVLATGRSGLRRLGWGPVRDTVLELRYVSASGKVVKAGGPTVKNVSGFDLCRLLVGSLGTLGLFAEARLRTRPRPAVEQWFTGEADPFDLVRRLHRPTAVLWDGTATWVLLTGHPGDVAAQAAAGPLVAADPAGVPRPRPHRWSLRPGELRSLPGDGRPFLAEVGVGTVWRDDPQPPRPASGEVRALHDRLKHQLDPTGRLAPGRRVLAGPVPADRS